MSFEVGSGECLALTGPSGSGKTRLLRAIADLDPAEGRVFFDGAEQSEIPAPEWRSYVRYVAAEPAWWTDTFSDGLPDDPAIKARVSRMVTALGLQPEDLDRPLAELSTGERQRLALVRALADDPQVLLLDEPTNGLDSGTAALVEEMIRFRMLSGNIVVLVSHDTHLLKRLATAHIALGSLVKPEGAAG